MTWALVESLKYDALLQHVFREPVKSRVPQETRGHGLLWESGRVFAQSSGIDASTTRLVARSIAASTGKPQWRFGRSGRFDYVWAAAKGTWVRWREVFDMLRVMEYAVLEAQQNKTG